MKARHACRLSSLVATLALTPSAATAETPFSPAQPITSAALGIQMVVTADLDRDGDLDVISASALNDTIRWHRNTGQAFSAVTITAQFEGASHLAVGDLDGDGDVDLAAASPGETSLSWFENRISTPGAPSSGFVEHSFGFAQGGWRSVAIADFDEDGKADLVASRDSVDQVLVLLQRPCNPPVPPGSPPCFGGAAGTSIIAADSGWLVVGDVDGETLPDFALAQPDDDDLTYWVNIDDGLFQPREVSSVPAGARSLALADLDGDGDLDIASVADTSDEVAWHRKESDVDFTAFTVSTAGLDPRNVAVGDVDRDGDLDLAIASAGDGAIAWLENDGLETFTRHVIATLSGASWVSLADLDGDGDLDVLAASSSTHTVGWYENLTRRRSIAFPQVLGGDSNGGGAGVATGDLDRDGRVDMVAAFSGAAPSGSVVRWYRNGGASGIVASGVEEYVLAVNSVELHDLDGDGDLDVLTAAPLGPPEDPSGGFVAWHDNEDGEFSEHHLLHASADLTRHATAGDLDGDGDLEVVAAVGGEGSIFLYANDGDGDFSGPLRIGSAGEFPAVRAVDLGDLDRDGDLDIAFAAIGEGAVGWLENEPGVGFERHDLDHLPFAAPFWVEIGDLDGDGDLDLVASSVTHGRVAWFENAGGNPATFSDLYLHSSGLVGATELELVDIDIDGDLDVLVATRNLDRVQWLENPGGSDLGLLLRRPLPALFDGALALAVADFQSDGVLDLAVACEQGSLGLAVALGVPAVFWEDFERGDAVAWSTQSP